jgi:hypothetical protein
MELKCERNPRFRHLVRNVYATNLSADRMTDLLDSLPALWPRIFVDLLAFATFLEQLAQADNGPAGQSSV